MKLGLIDIHQRGNGMTLNDQDPESSLSDVKQLGLIAAIGSLSYVFWVVGGMEMIERLA